MVKNQVKKTITRRSRSYEPQLKLGKVAVFRWNIKLDELSWSKSLVTIHNLPVNALTGNFKYFTQNIHPFDKERFNKSINKLIKKKKKFHIEYRITNQNEIIKHLELRGKVRINKNHGRIVEGVIIDITKRKRNEKYLEKTINRIQAILKNLPEGITVELKSGNIVYSNDAAIKILDVKKITTLQGINIKKLLKKFEIKDQKDAIVNPNELLGPKMFSSNKKRAKTYLFSNLKTETYKWIKLIPSEVESESLSPQLFIKIFQDVTKEVEEQHDAQTSLGVTSHELKNALTGLKAYIHLAKRRIGMNDFEGTKAYLDSLSGQSQRIIKLINDLFDVSRIRLGFLKLNKQVFNYSHFLISTVDQFKSEYPSYMFRYKIAKSLYVSADKDRLMQVVINLLTNAIKYSNQDKRIFINTHIKNGTVTTSIKDYGIGIPKEKQKEIFKLYKRVENKKTRNIKGLGVGLFITKGIIKAHQGSIKVRSSENKGSTFSFQLPVSK